MQINQRGDRKWKQVLAHTLFKDIKVNVDMAKDKASRAAIEIPLKSVQIFYLHCRNVMYLIKKTGKKRCQLRTRKGLTLSIY